MPADTLPKLGRREMARLVEIGTGPRLATLTERQPRTTDALVSAGLVERYRWRTMEFARPTPLGARVLASLPGDEFDRCRTLLETTDGARPD